MIVFLDGWSVVDLEAVVRCTDREAGLRATGGGWLVYSCTAPGPVWLWLCTVYSGCTQDCGGTEETLWHQSHWSEPEKRSGDQSQSDVKMLGEREQWHLVNIIQTIHLNTREDDLQRKLWVIFVRWCTLYICGDIFDNIMVFMHSGRHRGCKLLT